MTRKQRRRRDSLNRFLDELTGFVFCLGFLAILSLPPIIWYMENR